MAFNKKTWATGQTITATELNRMETGIDDANKTGSGDVGFITNTDVYLESFPRIGGETDDSPRIQRAVNSIPEGGNIIFPSGKSLVLNTTILLDPIDLQTSLTLDLNITEMA
jgi:polygalacturonase